MLVLVGSSKVLKQQRLLGFAEQQIDLLDDELVQ